MSRVPELIDLIVQGKNAEASDVLNSELLSRSYEAISDHKGRVATEYFKLVSLMSYNQKKNNNLKRNLPMKLIREEIESVQVIAEESNGKKTFHITGPFLQGDIKNRNGRIYESRILAKEVKRYNESYIEKNRAMGELGHPDGPTVNLDRVSHKITSLKQEGSNFIGKAKILETPMGRIAGALLNDGVTLGVSSRGMGSLVNRNGANYVGEDFMLATAADIVADPSAPDAFVQGIMEGKEWVWDNGLLREQDVERVRQTIRNASASRLNEAVLDGFHDLLMG